MGRKHPKHRTTASPTVAVGCLTLFGLPFALVGLFLVYSVCSVLMLYSRSASWHPTPATLEHLDLVRGTKPRSTHRVAGRYSYYFGGQRYTSERMTLSDAKDSDLPFHQDLYNRLNKKRQRGEQILCLVNPHHPAQAIMSRDLPAKLLVFEIIGALLFGGAGLGIILLGNLLGKNLHRIEHLERTAPGAGWKYRDDWAEGYIRNNASNYAIGYGVIAFFILTISIPGLLALPHKLLVEKNPLAFFLLVFPILGSVFLVLTVRSYFVWKRFGRARLRIVPMPLSQATPIEGRLELNTHLSPEINTVEAVLSCTKTHTRRRRGITIHLGSGDHSSDHTERPETLFSQRIIGRVQRTPRGTTIVYTFSVPIEYPPTTIIPDEEMIRWSLRVQASLLGADLDLDFDLPVIQMSNS